MSVLNVVLEADYIFVHDSVVSFDVEFSVQRGDVCVLLRHLVNVGQEGLHLVFEEDLGFLWGVLGLGVLAGGVLDDHRVRVQGGLCLLGGWFCCFRYSLKRDESSRKYSFCLGFS